MDELLKHLQNQWIELMKDMDSLSPPTRTVSVTSTRKASSS